MRPFPVAVALASVLAAVPVPSEGAAAPAGRPEAGSRPPARERRIRFNGRSLDAEQTKTLAALERFIGRIPDGSYWYDPRSGASGRWGGPALAFLPAGLDLGGQLPANASGGGKGTLTGVFINGRELHPLDVLGLQELVGGAAPGRWWVDAQGYFGQEGGPPVGNLVAMARARRAAGQGGKTAWSKHLDMNTGRSSDNLNMASDGTTTCVSVSGYSHCTGE